MKELKSSSGGYIGFIHFLIAGLGIPTVLGSLAMLIFIVLHISQTGLLWRYGLLAVSFIAIYLGVIYSSRYLKKTFIINNPNLVINYSMMYIIIWVIVVEVSLKGYESFSTDLIAPLSILLGVLLFYFLSKKCITSN